MDIFERAFIVFFISDNEWSMKRRRSLFIHLSYIRILAKKFAIVILVISAFAMMLLNKTESLIIEKYARVIPRPLDHGQAYHKGKKWINAYLERSYKFFIDSIISFQFTTSHNL